MRILLFSALAAASVASAAAHGAVVHRCRAADGGIVFRDAPCAIGESTLERREYVDPVTTALPAAVSPAPRAPRHPAGSAATAKPAPRADRIVAHECRFGEQRWVQAAACPRSLALAAGKAGKPVKQSVDETRLAESQVCGALRGISSADAPGEGSARRAYGMNRLRQQHGC